MLTKLKYMAAILLSLGLAACEKTDPAGSDTFPIREISISFPGDNTRSGNGEDTQALEEGEVGRLLYAIFDKQVCVHHNAVDLTGKGYHTGGRPYKLTDVKQGVLSVNSEVFVIANPPAEIEQKLLNGIDNPSDGGAKYSEWKNCVYSSKLNDMAAAADSRSMDSPVMAGYLKLQSESGTSVSIPVKHIYCRIWYRFEWRNLPETEEVVVDRIDIEGLREKTMMFEVLDEKSPDPFPQESSSSAIVNGDPVQRPFLGRLNPGGAGEHYHFGKDPQMYITPESMAQYNIVCRYTWSGGVMQSDKQPYRYYTYSFERRGEKIENDPLIKVSYHFTKKGANGDQVIRKEASARLYDEIYYPGKRHHGMLRNYTYCLRCIINTTTNTLEVQVSPHLWYKVTVDDIPPFE